MSSPDQPTSPPPGAQAPPATAAPTPPEPAQAPDPWQDERLPWEGKPRPADMWCLSLISLSGFYYMLLTPAIPSLLGRNPVLLALLAGSTPATVTSGAFAAVGRASLPLALLAGVIGLMKFDPLYWWAGHLWGRRGAHWIAGRGRRATRVIHRMEKLGARFGWAAVLVVYFIPFVPKGAVFAVAGWTGMRLRIFLALSVTGAALRTGLNVWLGYTIGQPAVDVAETISDYALWASIVLVVVIIGYQVWRGRRDQQHAAAAAAAAARRQASPPA